MRDQLQPPQGSPSRVSRPSARPVIVLGGILGAMLGAAATYSLRVWSEIGDTGMSASGYVALVIGVLVATGLGSGLMALVFYSSRRGFDDEIGSDPVYEMAPPTSPANDDSRRPAA